MNLRAEEILPILLRTTGLLALSVLVVRAVLGRLRPASPALCRAAYALALFQGILIARVSLPLPWGGPTMMSVSRTTVIPIKRGTKDVPGPNTPNHLAG